MEVIYIIIKKDVQIYFDDFFSFGLCAVNQKKSTKKKRSFIQGKDAICCVFFFQKEKAEINSEKMVVVGHSGSG